MPIETQILDNGVVLISEPIAGTKTAAIGFWFPCGSRDETDGNRGVTHFVEHLLFKGTSSITAYEIARTFDRIGGYINAFTEREMTCVYCVIPSRWADTAAAIMCDMVTASLFSDADIRRERVVIESEIISSLDDPEEAAIDAVFETVWPHSSLARSISGTVEEVDALDRQKIYDWYTAHFAEGPLAITAAGNIDTAVLYKRLSVLPERDPVSCGCIPVPAVPRWHSGRFYVPAAFQQCQVFVLYPVQYPLFDDSFYGLSILNAITGDTMSSRLFQRLREQNGYCYNVYSFFQFFRDTGFWGAYASSSKKNIEKVIADLRNELTILFEKGITETEIQDAKEHLCGEEIIGSEDMENRMKRLSRQFFFGFGVHSVEETLEYVRAIGRDKLEQYLKSTLQKKDETLLLYGPSVKKLHLENI